jgi:hypothetical protein
MLDYILARLSEPSTWKGVVWIATAFGLALSPDQQEAIASFGLTLVGLISVFIERGNAHTDEEIIQIVEEEHDKRVKSITVNNVKGKKNVKTKTSDSDNFFND